MSTPAPQQHWSSQGLRRLATAFVGQEHVGVLGNLILRLARYLQGDPSQEINLSAAAGTTGQLPDNTPAHSATFVVLGPPMLFRVDGTPPGANDIPVPAGTVITLTGQPTLKGFRFTTSTGNPVTINGSFFD